MLDWQRTRCGEEVQAKEQGLERNALGRHPSLVGWQEPNLSENLLEEG